MAHSICTIVVVTCIVDLIPFRHLDNIDLENILNQFNLCGLACKKWLKNVSDFHIISFKTHSKQWIFFHCFANLKRLFVLH